MKVEVETNSEGREDVELEGDDWGHKRDGRDHISYWRETGPHIENLQLMELCQWDGKIQTSWCRETDANSWADEILPLRWKNLWTS